MAAGNSGEPPPGAPGPHTGATPTPDLVSVAPGPSSSRPSEAPGPSPSSGGLPPVDVEVVRVLRGARLFRHFTDTGLAILGSIAEEKHVPAGTPLFVENMIGDGLYVIAEGAIRLWIRGPRGEALPLAVLGPGESLGEGALLRSGPRLCSAVAEVPSRVLEITRRDVALLQRNKPQACLKLMMSVVDVVGERLRDGDPELRQFLAWRFGV
jgi:CRP/FNR family cyclic AMP-dependent transcriptional regulator